MRYRFLDSEWDNLIKDELADEIENLDRAHKRAKKELRKQQKAIAKKNHFLDAYKYMLERSQNREMELEIMNRALMKELVRLKNLD